MTARETVEKYVLLLLCIHSLIASLVSGDFLAVPNGNRDQCCLRTIIDKLSIYITVDVGRSLFSTNDLYVCIELDVCFCIFNLI